MDAAIRGSGFVCADSNGVGLPVGDGTPLYQWDFDLTMANGALLTGIDRASVKGRFVDSLGHKVGSLVSERVTLIASPVPEPENYVLMLAGLGLVGLIARRRLSRA